VSDEQPVTWYHGTRRGCSRGGYVIPRSAHGKEGTSAPVNPGQQQPSDSGDYTYLTTSATLAWVYAWCAPGRGKPKVLTVEPMGNVYRDPEHSPDMEAYRCDGWLRVVNVDTEPIITEQEARDGWVTA